MRVRCWASLDRNDRLKQHGQNQSSPTRSRVRTQEEQEAAKMHAVLHQASHAGHGQTFRDLPCVEASMVSESWRARRGPRHQREAPASSTEGSGAETTTGASQEKERNS